MVFLLHVHIATLAMFHLKLALILKQRTQLNMLEFIIAKNVKLNAVILKFGLKVKQQIKNILSIMLIKFHLLAFYLFRKAFMICLLVKIC